MFDALFDGIAFLLAFAYDLIPNYAFAIAAVTLVVMLLLFPLNAKAQRSMAGMQKLQPELKRIQAKYKDDRVKQQEETMALFREHGVSPLGGCLPLLVQGPVLFIMYRVLIGLTNRGEDGTFAPKYLEEDSALFQALDRSREMLSFGIDLAKNASEAAQASFLGALPFFLVIAAVVATGYYQQRQISRRNANQPQSDNPMAKQMQAMTRIFPLMYLVFGFTLPAGMNVYFLVSNVFRIGQQALIYRLDPSLRSSGGERKAEAKARPTETKAKPAERAEEAPRPAKGSARPGPNGKAPASRSAAGARNKKKKKGR